MDSVMNAAENKLSKDAQPGNSFEGSSDNAVNQEVDRVAGDAGVPQQADGAINDAVDGKVNDEIPGGN
ncbi:hypothetical protein VMCG_05826 [Cytospora schulzeri]|uniref:Uncharacterized protein n=1 Tax=Cytospora schulzeri TaxID=448051 RepID=A0A423WI72_9PEZI|nr:hypothetical protein VMCG_05826 [Valsa malicola]